MENFGFVMFEKLSTQGKHQFIITEFLHRDNGLCNVFIDASKRFMNVLNVIFAV